MIALQCEVHACNLADQAAAHRGGQITEGRRPAAVLINCKLHVMLRRQRDEPLSDIKIEGPRVRRL